jgi:hypothetical protein
MVVVLRIAEPAAASLQGTSRRTYIYPPVTCDVVPFLKCKGLMTGPSTSSVLNQRLHQVVRTASFFTLSLTLSWI